MLAPVSRWFAYRRFKSLHLLISVGAALAASVTACAADGIQLALISPTALEDYLRAGHVSPRDRQNLVERLFQQAGCKVTLQSVDKHSSNVICDLPGDTSATIVVGAHFDFADEGQGIVDDWSGVSLLLVLYQTLKTERPKHTYEFVAFAGEERGLIGSSRYVRELTAERKAHTQAFINLECLGLNTPKVWVRRSTPMLVDRLARVAAAIHVPLEGVNVDAVGDDDTHPFLSRKISAISIHSVTQETWRILHSSRDNIGAVHPDDYYNAYRLVVFYLKYLDTELLLGALG
jgi:hypothetical protein